MGISRSTYYAVPQDSTSSALKRESNAALRSAIENVVAEWSAYGYRCVTHELRRRGIVANHKRVARIMRKEALTPRRMRRFLATTDSNHAEPIYPKLALGNYHARFLGGWRSNALSLPGSARIEPSATRKAVTSL
jgi:putative transposase